MSAASRMKLRHLAGTAAGLAMFALVFVYTGDADLLTAIGCGIGTALVFYFWAHLGDTGAPDGGA